MQVCIIYDNRKVLVPTRILEKMHLKPGTSKIVWIIEGEKVSIEPSVKRSLN